MVVDQFGAEHVDTAIVTFEHLDLLVHRYLEAVVAQNLGDRAKQAFGRRPIIGIDVEDQGVVELTESFKFVEHLAVLMVGVFGETGVDLHQPGLEPPVLLGYVVPSLHRVVDGSQLRMVRDPPRRTLRCVDAISQHFPTVVERPGIFVGPLLGDVMRSVHCARGEVDQHRLVRRGVAPSTQVRDRLIGEIFGQVVARLVGWLDGCGVFEQPRFVLRRLRGHETIEVVETMTRRPPIEWAVSIHMIDRRVMPFSERGSAVAVAAQDFGDRGRRSWDCTDVSVEVGGVLRYLTKPDRMMVAAGQHTCSSGRTHSGCMEPVVANTHVQHPLHGRQLNRPTERGAVGAAGIVGHEDHDVGSVVAQW